MMSQLYSLLLSLAVVATASTAQASGTLEVKVSGLKNGQAIPTEQAYCMRKADEPSASGSNRRPAISWSAGPEGTKSYAIVLVDVDVPTDFSNAGKAGKTLPASMKRQNFYHWAQINIPASANGFPAGFGNDLPERQPRIGVAALNDYAKFYKDKPKEEFIGYDGACPPWNDERLHHYHYQVFALSVPQLNLGKNFTAEQAVHAMKPYILGRGEVVGTYTLNPKLGVAE